MEYLVGDCLVASAFLSYMGPFLSQYRDVMMEEIWLKEVSITDAVCSARADQNIKSVSLTARESFFN